MVVILDNRIGGISVRSMAVAKNLQKFGIQSLFVLPNESGNLTEHAREQGFWVMPITLKRPSIMHPWKNIFWVISFPISVFILISVIQREKIDIVHVNGLMNLQAPIAAIMTRRKVVWHLAGTQYPKILVGILMPFISRVGFVVTISGEVDKYYRGQQYCSQHRIVREPVNSKKFSVSRVPQESRRKFRHQLDMAPSDYIIGSIGNISPVKGYEYLLNAVPLVLERVQDVQFVIIGAIFDTQKEYEKKLRSLVNSLGLINNIKFLGYRDDISELLVSFDVFVLPSIAEGTPIAILEAMAMEIPVVATRVGGVLDLVIHGCFCQSKTRPVAREKRAHQGIN